MVKGLSFKFEQRLGAFTMLLFDRSSEKGFLAIDLTILLGVRNFRNTSAMRVNFFLKIFKI